MRRNSLLGAVAGALLLAACGGGGDGGSGPGGGGGPSASERSAMAAALNDAALNAEAAGDGLGTLVLKAAAGMIGSGLTLTSVNGVSFSVAEAVPVRSPTGTAASGWAFGVEAGLVQSQEVGVFEGAVVISGSNVAYGLGLVSHTPGFVGSSFGAIWNGPEAGWAATTLTGFGVADTIIGGDCTGAVPDGLGVTVCVPASHREPGFHITASTPMSFPGNSATGSKTMTFSPARLRGAAVTVDCGQTTLC